MFLVHVKVFVMDLAASGKSLRPGRADQLQQAVRRFSMLAEDQKLNEVLQQIVDKSKEGDDFGGLSDREAAIHDESSE